MFTYQHSYCIAVSDKSISYTCNSLFNHVLNLTYLSCSYYGYSFLTKQNKQLTVYVLTYIFMWNDNKIGIKITIFQSKWKFHTPVLFLMAYFKYINLNKINKIVASDIVWLCFRSMN